MRADEIIAVFVLVTIIYAIFLDWLENNKKPE
jgi:hypothetical protein